MHSERDILHGPGPIVGAFLEGFKCGLCGGPASFRYRPTGGGDWWCDNTICNLSRWFKGGATIYSILCTPPQGGD